MYYYLEFRIAPECEYEIKEVFGKNTLKGLAIYEEDGSLFDLEKALFEKGLSVQVYAEEAFTVTVTKNNKKIAMFFSGSNEFKLWNSTIDELIQYVKAGGMSEGKTIYLFKLADNLYRYSSDSIWCRNLRGVYEEINPVAKIELLTDNYKVTFFSKER